MIGRIALLLALLGVVAVPARAASCWEDVSLQLLSPGGINTLATDSLDDAARKCLAELLADPETYNRVLHAITKPDSSGALLRDLQLEFKTFEVPDAPDATGATSGATRAHLGLAYRYDKSITTTALGAECGDACLHALDFRFSAQGNLALQAEYNPRDFLESHLTLAWFRSSGGAQRLTTQAQERYEQLTLQASELTEGQEAELAAIYKQISRLVADNLTNQLAVEFGADIALESDQRFTQKHWVYAARAALDFRGWSGLHAASWSAAPAAAKLNIFDYPFALIRRLTGYATCDASERNLGACFVPLSTAWPTISISIGQVQPDSGERRSRMTVDDDSYTRITSEVSFKTPIAKWQSEPVYVTANWRWYEELSAPAEVRSADAARFSYLVATVGPQRGVFASYSTGRLPFDRRDDQIYELGFRTIFD